MTVLSATSLNGTNVLNPAGDSLGEIKDLMIDTGSARVQYAVLDFGGFLGIGDKLFAVPLEAFRVDTANERLVLDMDKERLETAPGFPKDNWPNTADDTYLETVYDFYGQRDAFQRSRMTRPGVVN